VCQVASPRARAGRCTECPLSDCFAAAAQEQAACASSPSTGKHRAPHQRVHLSEASTSEHRAPHRSVVHFSEASTSEHRALHQRVHF